MAGRTKLIVIGGPTASGKTKLAIEVAEHLGTEIISGDSRQFYREMAIGNARPAPEELSRVRHHFIADRSITEPLTAGRFADEALRFYERRFSRAEHLVLVGGSGLYLRALCEGLDQFPEVSEAARSRVQCIWEEQGLDGLQTHLQTADPDYFATVDQQNPRRLVRALEVSLTAGQPYSSFLGRRPPRPFDVVYLTLSMDRPLLYDRINRRVDQMLEAGLEQEARALFPYRKLPVLRTVGYQEWYPMITGSRKYAEVVELIKRNSRRYAKRQVTWFKKNNLYQPVSGLEDALGYLEPA